MYRSRHRRGSNLGVMLLLSQVFNIGIENIPPVTLALVAGQTAIFLDFLPQHFPSAAGVCMSSFLVWHRNDWRRLIVSQFFHADDFHLYYNMASLLMKGRSLERRFGSTYFAYMITIFVSFTGLCYIGINMALDYWLQDHSYSIQCAVGFSGVLFALKVLTTHYSPHGFHYVMGFIPVPSRYLYWVELGLIQLVTPNVSFTGHLAGILVGLLYIKGPLKSFMDFFLRPASGDRGVGRTNGRRRAQWSLFGRAQDWFRSSNSTGYHGGMSEDEQYATAMDNSLRQSHSRPREHVHHSAGYPDIDQLRARRAERYS